MNKVKKQQEPFSLDKPVLVPNKKLHKMTKNNRDKIFWHNSSYEKADVVMFGMPYDSTASHKKGTVNAFKSIRNEAEAIEWYSPYHDREITDLKIHDMGDLKIEKLTPEKAYEAIYKHTKKLVNDGKFFVGIGGEHAVSNPEIKAVFEKYPDLNLIHIDAHTDLRDMFLGQYHSHANIVKRANDYMGKGRIYSFGIRSGGKEEFDSYKKLGIYLEKETLLTLPKIVKQLKNKPVFITIDIDVLDPSIMPGTGTTEPGGVTFKELMTAIYSMKELNNVVGMDLVELSPDWDTSLASTCVAVKLLREWILTIKK